MKRKIEDIVAKEVGKKTFLLPEIGHDGQHIYLIWESHAQRFPYTEGGLHKALKLIPHFASTPGCVTGGSNIATKLLDSRKAKVAKTTMAKRAIATATDAQKASALDILRRFKAKS